MVNLNKTQTFNSFTTFAFCASLIFSVSNLVGCSSNKTKKVNMVSVSATPMKIYPRPDWSRDDWFIIFDDNTKLRHVPMGIGDASIMDTWSLRRAAYKLHFRKLMWEGPVPEYDWRKDPRYPQYLENMRNQVEILGIEPDEPTRGTTP